MDKLQELMDRWAEGAFINVSELQLLFETIKQLADERDNWRKTSDGYREEMGNQAVLLQQKDDEIEQLTKREVPDMSQLTHNDLFQVKALISDNGADYLINVIRYIAKIEGK